MSLLPLLVLDDFMHSFLNTFFFASLTPVMWNINLGSYDLRDYRELWQMIMMATMITLYYRVPRTSDHCNFSKMYSALREKCDRLTFSAKCPIPGRQLAHLYISMVEHDAAYIFDTP